MISLDPKPPAPTGSSSSRTDPRDRRPFPRMCLHAPDSRRRLLPGPSRPPNRYRRSQRERHARRDDCLAVEGDIAYAGKLYPQPGRVPRRHEPAHRRPKLLLALNMTNTRSTISANTIPSSSSLTTAATTTRPSSTKAQLVIDTRNANRGIHSPRIVRC